MGVVGGCSAMAATLELQDDETLFGHLANGVRRSLARVAGVLDASVRHLVGTERRCLVDRDSAELERGRSAQRRLQVAREDPGLEAVARPVRERDRVVE